MSLNQEIFQANQGHHAKKSNDQRLKIPNECLED